ncbi:MAG: hypothetical protein IIZ78_05115 [Clostridiales bacterium]|nr:hypothetical protein [Clostridiales bacterium]
MWLISKDGQGLYNLNGVANLYFVGGSMDVAVRVSFAGPQKDLTVGLYDSTIQAKAAIRYVFDAITRGAKSVELPDEDTIEQLTRVYEMKSRAANGKKTVRRGGS